MLECKGGLTDKPSRCKSPQDLVLTLIRKSGEVEQAEMQSIRLLKFRSLIKLLKTLALLFEEIRVLKGKYGVPH